MSHRIAQRSQMQTVIRNFQRSLAFTSQFTGGLRFSCDTSSCFNHPDTPFCAALRITALRLATPRSNDTASESRADAPACYSSILENRWNVHAPTLLNVFYLTKQIEICFLSLGGKWERRHHRGRNVVDARSRNDQSLRIPTFVSRFSRFYVTYRSRCVCVLSPPSPRRRRSVQRRILDPRPLPRTIPSSGAGLTNTLIVSPLWRVWVSYLPYDNSKYSNILIKAL